MLPIRLAELQFKSASLDLVAAWLNHPGFSGRLSQSEFEQLMACEGTGDRALLMACLPLARLFSRSESSGFRVGAIAKGTSGSVYLGTNIEFPNMGPGLSVHAEQAVAANALLHNEPGLTFLAVTALPCGHCRQFFTDVLNGEDIEILTSPNELSRLSALLPSPFRLNASLPGPFSGVRADLSLIDGPEDDLVQTALASARRAWAPVTGALSGMALKTASGRIYTGFYLESSAFNPSLLPFQAAVVNLVLSGDDPSSIVSAALVELRDARIRQNVISRTALHSIAPDAEFTASLAELRLQKTGS